jgi:hypothetical protein
MVTSFSFVETKYVSEREREREGGEREREREGERERGERVNEGFKLTRKVSRNSTILRNCQSTEFHMHGNCVIVDYISR